MKTKRYYLIITVVIVLVGIFIFQSKVTIISRVDYCSVGIIDGEIDGVESNRIHEFEKPPLTKNSSHGSEMIDFVSNLCNEYNIYYFDATNDKGIITSEMIIEGLKQMENVSAKNINLSFSSVFFSQQLQDQIEKSKKNIFSSYNNSQNSQDYPAMYQNVIGVGVEQDIKFKNGDISRKNNSLLLNKLYIGNSYLSLEEAIKSTNK